MNKPNRTVLVAVLALAVAIIVAGAVWVGVDRRTAAGGQAPAGTAPTPGSTAATPAAASKCGLTGTAGMPTSVPARWENFAGWSLPISPTDGPGMRSPTGPWSCYTHTPTGAVLAGYVIAFRAEGVAENWKTVVREQTMPGAAQAVKLASTPTEVSQVVTPKGFTVAAYTDAAATISYYLHSEQLESSCTINVAWYEDDWRVQLQDDGSTASGCVQGVPASFVSWGPS